MEVRGMEGAAFSVAAQFDHADYSVALRPAVSCAQLIKHTHTAQTLSKQSTKPLVLPGSINHFQKNLLTTNTFTYIEA